MIKFENTQTTGWAAAIRGMRNPLNSWDKSDSKFTDFCELADYVGPNDLDLMKRLIKAGSDHSKFMRMINVTVDITAPMYWWKEFDTYKVGTVRNSCSTMHTIHKRPFTIDDFSHEKLFNMKDDNNLPDNIAYLCNGIIAMNTIVSLLNSFRENYLVTKDKKYWYSIIQLLPSSYNQRATVQLNYQVLRNIYKSDRRHHKLDEWRVYFMEWINGLPYSDLITMEVE